MSKNAWGISIGYSAVVENRLLNLFIEIEIRHLKFLYGDPQCAKICHEEKADVALWLQFLEDFNGQCYFPDKYWVANDVLQLFTDSNLLRNAREEGIALEQ
jgi:hypothetical protein